MLVSRIRINISEFSIKKNLPLFAKNEKLIYSKNSEKYVI